MKHIENCHKNVYVELENVRKRKQNDDNTTGPDEPSTSMAKQQKISSFIQIEKKSVEVKYKTSTDELRQAVLEMMTVNGRPMTAINDTGFRKILNPILNSFKNNGMTINIPNLKNDLTQEALKIRIVIKEEVKDRLISLKLDCATRMNRAILGVNIQYVEKSLIVLRTLDMIQLEQKHTGEYLVSVLINILTSYDIKLEQIYTITTDNGSNMLKAIRELQPESDAIDENIEAVDGEE